LVGLASEGKTIFFSSHHVFEVEQISDYIIMLHKGKLIDSRPLDQMKSSYKIIKTLYNETPTFTDTSIKGIKRVVKDHRSLLVFADDNEREIIEHLKENDPTSIEVIKLNLKEIFLENLKAIESYAA
jgi:ABC-type multidrug transport system ATPase subunit